MKRVILFLITNLAVIVLLTVVANLLGVHSNSIVLVALVFGMGGAFISLAISKWSAKWMTGARVIESPSNATEAWLVETVKRHAQAARIGMPEVAIYDSGDMNAFATGMSRNSSLVAVSSGLLSRMEKKEVDAVLAHEVSHIANGDMVTLALIQGIVNTFVILLSRVVGYAVDQWLRGDEESSGVGIGYFVTSIIAEIVFGILAMPIVMWFSRQREFRADAGAANLSGKDNMIAALTRLQMAHTGELPDQFTAFGIASSKSTSLMQKLFSSHPPIEERIAALQVGRR
jgi:heat shock protein HtpX